MQAKCRQRRILTVAMLIAIPGMELDD